MTRLLTSSTDLAGTSARRQDSFLNSNAVEKIDAWSRLPVSWQWCNLPGHAGELTARTAPHIGPFSLLRDATELWDVTDIPLVFFNGQNCLVLGAQTGVLLRLNSQRDLSAFTEEPSEERRWMTIVQEGLGTTAAAPVDDTKVDPVLSDVTTIDCIMFCKQHAILDDLQKCLAEAKQQFSNVVTVKAELDQFPSDEYEEEGHVVIRVELASEQDQAFQDYDSYMDWMLDNVAGEKKQYFFVTFSCIV